jgi:hypothetical protein
VKKAAQDIGHGVKDLGHKAKEGAKKILHKW